MRILKPLRLGLLSRPYQYQGGHHLGLTVLALATMDAEPVLLAESELWKMMGEELDEDEAVDLSIPKPCAEFLVSGKAWSHDPASPGRCAVLVQVADREKRLLVTGKRAWVDDGATTEPLPVHGVPVNWRHAYGGPGFDENPVGLGAATDAHGVRQAPQVEDFDRRMMRSRDKCAPAGLGPVSPIRPRRFKLTGSYDPSYIEKAFPGLPDNLDPHYFNAASPDQWFRGMPELPEGAPYRIGNMHPAHAILEGEVPRWRARVFLRRGESAELEEVALRHTTVWFFPDRERMVLMFHGAAPLQTDDGSDLSLIMPALELADAPARDPRHYQLTVARRLSKEHGAAYALRDSDLVPATLMRELVDMKATVSTPLAVNMRQRALNLKRDMLDRVKEEGHDPAAYRLTADLPEPDDMSLDEIPDHLRRMRRQARLAKLDAARQRREGEARLEAEFAASKAGASGMQDARQQAQDPPPGGPPKSGAQGDGTGRLVELAREVQSRHAGQVDVGDIERMLDEAQARRNELYRHGAHLQQPVQPALPGRSVRMRRRVEGLMQGSRNLSGLDLTGVDLSGMDLSGARCHGAWMESADLSGANLSGADLRRAVLTRATLDGANCGGADFTEANLGAVQARQADFARARFEKTVMDQAYLEDCNLQEAALEQCAWMSITMIDCRFEQARLRELMIWQDSKLSGGSHAGARLERVTWLQAALEGANYDGATLESCTWMRCEFDSPPSYLGAFLTSCAFVESPLHEARFNEALLRDCNLRDSELEGADFSHARLHNCDLSESNLRDARFVRADARGSLFMGAYWEGADLRDADLIDALMTKGDFRRADLRGANLFRTDVSQGILDDTTLTAGAYVKQTKTLPAAPGKTSP